MDERASTLRLGVAVRHRAAHAADQARAAGTCGHPGARFCTTLAPEAGAWCVACGAAHIGDLLTTPWCLLCDAYARPGLTAARSDRLEVLIRACDPCLTRDTTPEGTP